MSTSAGWVGERGNICDVQHTHSFLFCKSQGNTTVRNWCGAPVLNTDQCNSTAISLLFQHENEAHSIHEMKIKSWVTEGSHRAGRRNFFPSLPHLEAPPSALPTHPSLSPTPKTCLLN